MEARECDGPPGTCPAAPVCTPNVCAVGEKLIYVCNLSLKYSEGTPLIESTTYMLRECRNNGDCQSLSAYCHQYSYEKMYCCAGACKPWLALICLLRGILFSL